jgi:hypothetical protein
MLFRYAGAMKTDAADLSAFPDADHISDWALDAMKWAVETGLLNGNENGQLMSQGQTTRAEAAAILYRFLQDEK